MKHATFIIIIHPDIYRQVFTSKLKLCNSKSRGGADKCGFKQEGLQLLFRESKNLGQCWVFVTKEYPTLGDDAIKVLIAFSTTYLYVRVDFLLQLQSKQNTDLADSYHKTCVSVSPK